MKYFPSLLLLLSVCAVQVSCKKNSDKKQDSCRVVKISRPGYPGNPVDSLVYDDQGRLFSVNIKDHGDAWQRTFTYNGNTIRIQHSKNGVIQGADSVYLNGNGLIEKTVYRPVANTGNYLAWFTYTGTQLASKRENNPISGEKTTTVLYNSGNLASTDDGTYVTNYRYSTDRESVVGDYFWWSEYSRYGAVSIKTRNLVSAIVRGANTSTVNYLFDSNGNITRIELAGEPINLEWSCN